jgi:hypothetical protein
MQQPHGGDGESMQQTPRHGDDSGDENKRQTQCGGGGGGESRQQTPGGSDGSSGNINKMSAPSGWKGRKEDWTKS